MTLYLYLIRQFGMNLIKVQVILLGIVLLFDSVDLIQRFKGNASIGEILGLSLVRAPASLSQTFPLVILIASLWTYISLARSSELVVARAAGVSGLKLVMAPIILTAVLGILAFSVMNPIVAATRQREAHILEALGNPIGARLSLSGKDIWLRQAGSNGQMVVEADRSAPDGTALFGVRMFLFDTNGKIESRLEAPVAKLLDGEWLLQDARRWIISDNPTPLPEKFPELRVETNLSSDQLLNSFARPETIPFWDLRGFIKRMEDSGFSGVRHRMFLQTELAKPVVYVAMVLIGCAFSMRPTRFGNTASMILGAILAGFAFYFVLDVAASFGAAKQVPIGVAAWAPPIAAIMLAFTLLLHFEDG